VDKEELVKFQKPLDSDIGIFEGFFNIAIRFPQFHSSYLWWKKTDQMFMKILSPDTKVPSHFGSYSDPD